MHMWTHHKTVQILSDYMNVDTWITRGKDGTIGCINMSSVFCLSAFS